MQVPIVFSTDDNYAIPTSIAIVSILRHYSGKSCKFIILYYRSLSDESMRIIKKTSECNRGIDVSFDFINVESVYDGFKSRISHISDATFYRLYISKLLPQFNKCLYLDGDILAMGDINDLINLELEDNIGVAGCIAGPIALSKKKTRFSHAKLLQISNLKQYINAGVLLINLDYLRENDVTKAFIKSSTKQFPIQDQDVINSVLFGHIKVVEPKYNRMPYLDVFPINQIRHFYTKKEIVEAKKSPVIVHFADEFKPWKYYGMAFGKEWIGAYHQLYKEELILKPIPIKKRIDSIIRRIFYFFYKYKI